MDILREMPHIFLGSRLKRLAEQMQAEASLLASDVGTLVPPGLFPILALLDSSKGCTVGDLARAIRVSQPAMTKSVNRLTDEGLVVSSRGEKDKRQSLVELTEAGRAAVDQGRQVVWPLIDIVVRDLLAGMSGPFLEQLDTLENRLAEESLAERIDRLNPVSLRPACDADVAGVVSLLNRAYRGEGEGASWTTETGLISGDRISETTLRTEIAQKPLASLLVWKKRENILGCVWVEPVQPGTWYLGSLAIDPKKQNAQCGRQLLAAAEQWCQTRGAECIHMTVLEARDTLIKWYERRGYCKTGETEPFPYDDDRFGVPSRPGLQFEVMKKVLETSASHSMHQVLNT
ncbi:GNAT family N-acetyltransferase [Pseudomonas sp. CCM 7891]|uniref:GNAT family N-acetyltransferase n=1 Tax=Pseudomonas karstica TaxID=1055468 RepID=A0A7X2RQN0_9PSED|nr:bifunctional helix-turn-helix transcriptional regulator/GNAT family N-acetyltransferase [Pseudomonas karstica]MTD19321.1 GNAT family N-acetyltransferase [Pseudomonas karstica]